MKQHISHNGREEHWRALMTACDQRPAGQSITDWLRDNGMIIPGLFEPPVRTLGATIPENESRIFR